MFDIVNLVVYLAVFIATTFCPRPMALLTPVAVAGANAVYFGGSLVGRPFSDELARESAPEGVRCCFFAPFVFASLYVRPCARAVLSLHEPSNVAPTPTPRVYH